MPKTDMSPQAIATRLHRVSQLRDLCLSLRKAGRALKCERTGRFELANQEIGVPSERKH